MKSHLNTLLFLLLVSALAPVKSRAQQGSEDIYRDIQKLGVLANVLYVAAHPDDENTRLISYLSNHVHANTTYLSLTRGDGGQNLIGSEIREMLGLIRTHELLGARAIDGGHQLFTRANDFGYSKTPTETFNIWDRDAVLSDVVWAIRKTKPDVIINRFNTDTSRPNHGHHTASAILAVEAFDLAGNPSIYPDQLPLAGTWQPKRIFWNTSWWFYGSQEAFAKVDKTRMLAIDIGAYDPISGESNSEIAGRSRSMHKSQGFGSAETRGESLDYIDLIKDTDGRIPKDLFDGIDITWSRVPGGQPIGTKVKTLEQQFDFKNPSASLPLLLDIHRAISQLADGHWRTVKLAECESLICRCLGLFVEARTRSFKAGPGAKLPATLEVINRSNSKINLLSVEYPGQGEALRLDTSLGYNKVFLKELTLVTPEKLSIPYWLEEHPTEGMYVVNSQALRGMPADPPAMHVKTHFSIEGHQVSVQVPVIFKTVDPAEGEITRPVSIVPPVSVKAGAEVLVFQQGQPRQVELVLTASQDSVEGVLHLNTSESGWTITPGEFLWSFLKAGETKTITCQVIPPARTSRADLKPEIRFGGKSFHHQITTLEYDHLPYMSVVTDATVHLQSMDIRITPRPIAYINGAGDDVPVSLRQIGYDVDVIDPVTLDANTLSTYEVVILGVRAFNTVEALAHKNKILFDWVEKGGTMIVQYNVNRGLVTEDIAPFPLSLSRDRITEENTAVNMLQPDHLAMTYPNKMSAADFEGWVQERGLYYPNKWDESFTPLLDMADSGEKPTQGALLVAPHGKGYYVYSGLSWFRHLPAGNPGPYRLLSNLISLGAGNGKS